MVISLAHPDATLVEEERILTLQKGVNRVDFSWKEILDLVHNEPGLMEINAGVKHKTLKDIDHRALKR